MPNVRFYETVPTKAGTEPAQGSISFTPTLPHFVSAKEHVLPEAFSVPLVAGAADVFLHPTKGWGWKVCFYPTKNSSRYSKHVSYVVVPDTDKDLDWADLEEFDVKSLKIKQDQSIYEAELRSLEKVVENLSSRPHTSDSIEYEAVSPGIISLKIRNTTNGTT